MVKLLNELARDYLARKLGDPIFYLCLRVVTNQLDMTVAREETQKKYQSCIRKMKRNESIIKQIFVHHLKLCNVII